MLNEKPIKAGLVGPEDLLPRAAQCAREIENRIEVSLYPYEEEEQIVNLYQRASEENEVILFTGPLAYSRVQGAFPQWVVPSAYVPYSPEWLYPSLLRLLSQGHNIRKVSIDGFGREIVKEVFREIGLDSSEVIILEAAAEEDLYRLHRRAYEEGRIAAVITCIRNVYRKLRKDVIPVEWAVPTNSALRELLEKGIILGTAAREAGRQIAVGILELDGWPKDNQGSPYEYKREKLILEVHRLLLSQFERIGAFVTYTRPGSFLFITTRGSLKELTCSFRSFELIAILKKELGVSASVGIGFGRTSWDAGQMAYKAVQMAVRNGGNCCYLLSDTGELWGPLQSSQALKVEVCVTSDQALFHLAQKAGCSPATLSKVISALSFLPKEVFSSEDLARITGVSLRSAQRMIRKLLEAGMIKKAGVEKISAPGRNKALYVFSPEAEEVRKVSGVNSED